MNKILQATPRALDLAREVLQIEAAAIEAGANDFETLTHEQNDDIPTEAAGARRSPPVCPR